MSQYYDAESGDKIVADGDTAYAEDLNKVNRAVETMADLVEADILSATVIAQNSSNAAEAWATSPIGTNPPSKFGQPLNTTEYSAKANAAEAASWANQAEDVPVVGADGQNKPGMFSGKHWAAKANAEQVVASAAKDAAVAASQQAGVYRDAAEGFAEDAQASALSALGSNMMATGAGMTVTPSGTGPYLFTVDHANTSDAGNVNTEGAQVIDTLTFDTYGHVIGSSTRALSYSDIGAASSGHTHNNYAPYNSVTGKLVGVSGTNANWSCLNISCGAITSSGVIQAAGASFTGGLAVHTMLDLGPTTGMRFNGLRCMEYFSNGLYIGEDSTAANQLALTSIKAYDYVSLSVNHNGLKSVNLSYNGAFYPHPDNAVHLGVGGQRWAAVYAVVGTIQTSDERLKNFSGSVESSFIYDLEPMEYTWKDDDREVTHFGFSAQAVESVLGRDNTGLITTPQTEETEEGHPLNNPHYSLNYSEFIAPMVKCIQEQMAMIRELQTEVRYLRDRVYGIS